MGIYYGTEQNVVENAVESKGISSGGPFKVGVSKTHNEICWVEDRNGTNVLAFKKDGHGAVWTDPESAKAIVDKWNSVNRT